jgi:hypothetical protein
MPALEKSGVPFLLQAPAATERAGLILMRGERCIRMPPNAATMHCVARWRDLRYKRRDERMVIRSMITMTWSSTCLLLKRGDILLLDDMARVSHLLPHGGESRGVHPFYPTIDSSKLGLTHSAHAGSGSDAADQAASPSSSVPLPRSRLACHPSRLGHTTLGQHSGTTSETYPSLSVLTH